MYASTTSPCVPPKRPQSATMQGSTIVYVRIQHEDWSNSFFCLTARLIDKMAWATWLQRTNRVCIALRIEEHFHELGIWNG